MKNTKKRRAMELLHVVAHSRGRRDSSDSGSPARLGRAARAAVIAGEAAALLSMARRIRSGRGRRILPIVAPAYLARHIGAKPPGNS